MRYLFGGFGCANAGDEAILAGMKLEYPGSTTIYVNKPGTKDDIFYADLLEDRVQFNKDKHSGLIIGGGGILHCKQAVDDHLAMAIKARQAGLDVTIEGVGLTELKPEWEVSTKMLLSMASKITVRDTTSAKLAERLGYKAEVRKDFAYNLEVSPRRSNGYGIGVIPAPDSNLPDLIHRIAFMLDHTDVWLIPHSRAYVSAASNDVITCEKIWSNWALHRRRHNLHILPFYEDVENSIQRVKAYKGIYSARLHGCIFADIAGTPVTSPVGKPKIDAFYADNPQHKQFITEAEFESWVMKTLAGKEPGARSAGLGV